MTRMCYLQKQLGINSKYRHNIQKFVGSGARGHSEWLNQCCNVKLDLVVPHDHIEVNCM